MQDVHSPLGATARPLLAAPAWPALSYFSLYRVLLASLLLGLVTWGGAPQPLGQFDISLFAATAGIYLAFSLAAAACAVAGRPGFDTQVATQVFGDIGALTVLMHASGGVTSGFGLLLVVAIAGGSILSGGRVAILFAAIAALAVLTQQFYAELLDLADAANYPHAGMLGAAFFASAVLSNSSARRVRTSEALAARRASDLANLAELNDHIIQRMQSGIVALDAAGRIRLVNASALRLLGLHDAPPDRPVGDVSPALFELFEGWRRDSSRATHLLAPDGLHLKVQASFAALGQDATEGVLVFLEDAAALDQRAQQLKLAGLGRLAASIAHEIRNPLGAVSHANQLLQESPALDRGDRRLIQIIGDNALRMNEIVENVLQLSRRAPAAPEPFVLGAWLESFRTEFAAGRGLEADQVVVTVAPPDMAVRVDPSQLRQVISNLCENALQHVNGKAAALDLHGGISVDTERPYLEITDNGEGIPPAVVEHLFEPFYTTRSNGTGLGLYLARELCEANQASLNYVATASGCRFRITFADPRRQGVNPR